VETDDSVREKDQYLQDPRKAVNDKEKSKKMQMVSQVIAIIRSFSIDESRPSIIWDMNLRNIIDERVLLDHFQEGKMFH
jgi:hypothetical protein